MLRAAAALSLAILMLMAGAAEAQMAVEVRGGTAVGNHTPAASGLQTDPGLSFSVTLELRALPCASLYVGGSTATFGCTDGFCTGTETTIRSQALGGGIRLHPPRVPWVRGGLHHHATRIDTGADVYDEDGALGYELATGITIRLSENVRLLPGMFYRSQHREGRTTVIGAEVGMQVGFNRW